MKRVSAPSKREGATPSPADKITIAHRRGCVRSRSPRRKAGRSSPTAAIVSEADLPAGRRGDHPHRRDCVRSRSPRRKAERSPPPPRLRPEQISPPEGGEITIPAPPRLQRCGVFRCGAPCGGPAGRGPGGVGSHPTPPPADFRVFYPMRGRRGCPRPAAGDRPRAQAQIKERGRKLW